MDSTPTKQQSRGNSTLAGKARDRIRRVFRSSQASPSHTLRQEEVSNTTKQGFQAIHQLKSSSAKTFRNNISFLDLPLELRQQIYRYCLVRPKTLVFPSNPDRPPLDRYYIQGRGANENFRALLVLCKQISSEAISILYGENIFQLHVTSDWAYVLKSRAGLSQEQLSRVRRVQFFVDTKGPLYGLDLEEEIWAPFLAQLSWISVVVAPNHHNRSYGEQHALYVKEVKEWTEWLGPVLKCFEKYLSKGCYLQIDDNGVKESRAVIEKCFGNRYRKVECPDADLLFRRGDYSWQSGYWDDQIEFWFYP